VAANNSGGFPVILKTTNGGATWPATSVGSGWILTGISCGSTTHCVAVDLNGNTFATTDGTNWGPAVPVVITVARPNLYGISCWDALDCVAVGAAGASGNNLYWTGNSGSTWHGEASGAALAILSGVSCPASTCVGVGERGEIATNYPLDFVYTNIQTTVTNKRLTRVSCVTTNDCWAVGDGGIFATTNGGTTWTNQHSTYSLLGINCPSATTCFAVGANLIVATTDGGKTWTFQPLGTTAVLSAVSCPNTTTCFAAGTKILATTDGKTWITQKDFSPTPGAFGIACTSSTTCAAVGYAGGIFRTFDGKTWSQAPSPTINTLQDVSCSTAWICVAVGDSGTTIATTNGGKSWFLQPSSTTKYLTGIGCLFGSGSEQCYAGTYDGYILSTGSAGALWAQEAQQELDLAGVSCAGVSNDYRCVVVGDGGTIVSKLTVPNSGGGGGGHCGTPSNPCQQ
jgi:photosystem II stability/assembly factor-like uncharacterized protein